MVTDATGTGWGRMGGVLAVLAVVGAGAAAVTFGTQGPAAVSASAAAPVAAEQAVSGPVKIDLYEGGIHEPATRSAESTHRVTAPNARQWLTARSR